MAQKKWDSTSIPDQKDRVAIITGSNTGIGYETARVLANKKATVIIAVRNLEKGNAAANQIRARHENTNVKVMALDLTNLKSVNDFATDFKNDYKRLDLLINNAGVMFPPYSKTADGFEIQLGTNHLGHFALTRHLLDLLMSTESSRIVNLSSTAHKWGNINFEDIHWEKRKYKTRQAYYDSKIANLYFTYEMARKLNNNNYPMVVASHPGWTTTELQRHSGFLNFMNNFFGQDMTMGALPTLYAAVESDVNSADYYGPSGFMEFRGYPKKVESNELSYNEEIAQRLWDISEELTKINYDL
jgi:NAD(P)-dependent dehydrogenase (short-subunit alcohol dehydrogenase family)